WSVTGVQTCALPIFGTVWGDSAKGAHGSFLRLPKGFVSPAHLHSGDYYGVIVEGAVTNAEAGQREVVLGPGSYYFQKGKADHVTDRKSLVEGNRGEH